MTKNIIMGLLVVALLVLGSVHFSGGTLLGATGQTFYQKVSFLEGLSFGTTRQGNLSREGYLTINSGTQIKEHGCGTATWNPAAVGSTTIATTSVTVAGSIVGDSVASVALSSVTGVTSTEAIHLTGAITAANTATVSLSAPGIGAGKVSPDFGSGTLRVCYQSY
jgi:hypothetical protein